MRGKGKGHRFDYLFRRFDKITAVIDLNTDDLSINEVLNRLVGLRKEVSEKECFSDYETHDRLNLLNQIDWYLRFYAN